MPDPEMACQHLFLNWRIQPRSGKFDCFLKATTALAVILSGCSGLVFLSVDEAHANCSPTTGDVVCSSNFNGNFMDAGQIDSFTVNDNVAVTSNNNNNAVLFRNSPAAVGSFLVGANASIINPQNNHAVLIGAPVTLFTNNGTIRSDLSDALNIFSFDGAVVGDTTINNNGTIATASAGANFALRTNFSNAALTVNVNNANGAKIDASTSNGFGIRAQGSEALVVGNSGEIIGGALAIDASGGGMVTITNNSTGVVRIGNNTRTGATDYAIQTGAGADLVSNAGIIRSLNSANGGIAVQLGGGDDTFEVQTGSQIFSDAGATNGNVDGGSNTDTLRLGGTGADNFGLADIGAGQSFQNFENFSVVGGTWSFSGTTTEDFTINGGTVKGTGTFGGFAVNNGATIAPGNSIGTINTGNLNLAAGSTLLIEVSQAGADQVNVVGTVSIDNGATLQLDDLAPALQDAAQTFVIINNDGNDAVTGNFGTITDNLAFLTPAISTAGGDGNDVELSFVVNNAPATNNNIGGNANNNTADAGTTFGSFVTNTTNQSRVGKALDSLSNTEGSAGRKLRNLLLVLTRAQALQTYKDLSGDVHSSVNRNFADIGGQFGDALGKRFANINGGRFTSTFDSTLSVGLAWPSGGSSSSTNAAAPSVTETTSQATGNIWGSLTGYQSNYKGDGNGTATSGSGHGLVAGVDQQIDPNTVLGFAASYGMSNVSANSGRSKLDLDSYTFSLYGSKKINGFDLNGFVGYTHHDIEGTRQIPLIGLTANSDYSADQFTVQAQAAYRIEDVHDGFDVLPFVIGNYSRVSTNGFTETGAGAANLISPNSTSDTYNLTLGLRFEKTTDLGSFYLGGGYQHRLGDEATQSTYAFSGGGSFTVEGVARKAGSGYFEAGFEAKLRENVTLFADGAINYGSDFDAYSGGVGIKVSF